MGDALTKRSVARRSRACFVPALDCIDRHYLSILLSDFLLNLFFLRLGCWRARTKTWAIERWSMHSYQDGARAVELYIKLGERVRPTIWQLGYPTKMP
jgi:hypothetical protein